MDEEQVIPAAYGQSKKPSGSNTGLLIIIFILLLILVAGGAYLFGSNKKTAENVEVSPTPSEEVTPTETPTPIGSEPTPIESGPSFKAASAVVAVAPTEANTCPTTFNFSAMISVNGAGTVKYQWEKSDGSAPTPETISFLGTGTKTVKTSWKLYGAYSGWEKLVILSPNTLESNQAEFKLVCPTPTIKFELKTPTIYKKFITPP